MGRGGRQKSFMGRGGRQRSFVGRRGGRRGSVGDRGEDVELPERPVPGQSSAEHRLDVVADVGGGLEGRRAGEDVAGEVEPAVDDPRVAAEILIEVPSNLFYSLNGRSRPIPRWSKAAPDTSCRCGPLRGPGTPRTRSTAGPDQFFLEVPPQRTFRTSAPATVLELS